MKQLIQNIKLYYLYRDGANFKQYSEVIFKNPDATNLKEIEVGIITALIESTWFNAKAWDVPELFFHQYKFDASIDHGLHEFHSIAITSEKTNDERTINEFIKYLQLNKNIS